MRFRRSLRHGLGVYIWDAIPAFAGEPPPKETLYCEGCEQSYPDDEQSLLRAGATWEPCDA